MRARACTHARTHARLYRQVSRRKSTDTLSSFPHHSHAPAPASASAPTSTSAPAPATASPLASAPAYALTLRLSIQVESGEFVLVGSNSGRQSEQGGGQLGGGGGTYVNDEVTGWKINDVALNCTPSATTVSTSATYHPDDPWYAFSQNSPSDSSSSNMNESTSCVFTIQIARTSGVFIISIVVPVMLSVYLCFSVFFAKPDDLETRSATFVTLFLALSAVQFVIDSQLPRSSVLTQFGYLVIISYVFISLTAVETLIVYLIAERLEKDVAETMGDMAAAATLTTRTSRAEPEPKSPQKVEKTCAFGSGKADGAGEESQELCPVVTEEEDEEVGEGNGAAGSGGGEKFQAACLNPEKPPLKKAEGHTWKFSLFGYHLKPVDDEHAKSGNYLLATRIDFVCCTLFFLGYTLTGTYDNLPSAPPIGIAGGRRDLVSEQVGVGVKNSSKGKRVSEEPSNEELASEEPSTGESSSGEIVSEERTTWEHFDDGTSSDVVEVVGGDEGGLSTGEQSSDSDAVEVSVNKPALRRSTRSNFGKPREKMSYHACLPPTSYNMLLDDAQSDVALPELDPDIHADLEHCWDIATMIVKEALASWKGKAAKAAMDEEIRSLISNGTWELVEHPCVACWVLVYVDDVLAASSNTAMLKELLETKFEPREISPVDKYLGLEIVRDRPARKLWLHQQNYFTFDDEDFPSHEEEEYRHNVSSLQFVTTTTRPDIAFACIKLGSGFTVWSDQHWREVDRCLVYLADTRDVALEFGSGLETLKRVGYADADDAGDKQTHSSTNGYVFVFGGACVSWTSQRIKCVILSSTESEYIAAIEVGKEARQLHFLLAEFQLVEAGTPTVMNMDNQSAITVAEGLRLNGNLKHMERCYAWLQQMVKRKKIAMEYIPTSEQPTEFLTKALHFPAFNRCTIEVGQVCLAVIGDDDDVQQ
ncbi:unnamed protein product [Closterium sp. NIES-53]